MFSYEFDSFFFIEDSFPSLEKSFGMLWRFAPMADAYVEQWHSRLEIKLRNYSITNNNYSIFSVFKNCVSPKKVVPDHSL